MSLWPVTPTPNPATGLGVVTVSGATPSRAAAYDVQITTSGQVGAAVFKYRESGGAYVTGQTTAATFAIPGGPTVSFKNDPLGGSPSFVSGDVYSFSSSGALTLAQLLTPQNLDTIRTRLLATFQGAGFPAITEWQPKGGVEMGFVTMVGSSIADLIAADLPDIIAGGFLGKAAGKWLDLLAETVYLLERVSATKTTFDMDLLVGPTATTYTWAVGDVEIIAPSGNRYRSTTAGTGKPGSFATLSFEAEAEGASYNDNPGIVEMELVTTFAGVTVRAAAPPFSPVTHTGVSTGQLIPSAVSAGPAGSYVIRIDTTGDAGAARASLQIDGGAWNAIGLLQATSVIVFGISLRVLNGSGTPSSFVAGDRFTFSVPGGASYVPGSDAETDSSLAQRCRLRWPSLSLNPTDGVFELWALFACPAATRIHVAPDLASDPTAIPGRVRMRTADSSGPLDPSGLDKINAYIGPKMGLLDSFLALPAVVAAIVPFGSVLVTPSSVVAVQQAAEKGWAAYLGQIPLGGIVEIAVFEQILMDAGAIDVGTDLALSLNEFPDNVHLAPGEVPVSSGSLTSLIEWVF
jgi:hypothetical protein